MSRVKIKNYEIIDAEPLIMQDKNNNSIAITAITVGDKPDNFVHIKSAMKEVKELSLYLKLSARFEKEINHLIESLSKKGAQNIARVYQSTHRKNH